MINYIKPKLAFFNVVDISNCYASSEKCTVVCTYMYGYCGEKEGWGTTYCPNWAK